MALSFKRYVRGVHLRLQSFSVGRVLRELEIMTRRITQIPNVFKHYETHEIITQHCDTLVTYLDELRELVQKYIQVNKKGKHGLHGADQQNEESLLVEFLAGVSLFEKLTRSERKNLSQYLFSRRFSPGDFIFKKGYPNVVFYIVRTGEVNILLENGEHEHATVRKLPRDFFGEIGLFLSEKRSATVIADRDTEMLAISKRDLANFISRFPEAGSKILYKLGEILSGNLIDTNALLREKNEEIHRIHIETLKQNDDISENGKQD